MTDSSDTSTVSGGAWGAGIATITDDGSVLDTWYPKPQLGTDLPDGVATKGGMHEVDTSVAADLFGSDVVGSLGPDEVRRVRRVAVVTVIDDLQAGPVDTADAYLRLHLLSHRIVPPNSISMDGMFGALTNAVWTSAGPCAVEGFEETRMRLRASGVHVTVHGIDKFPRMVDYVVPAGVRIADASRVRLGAHLAAGTTVMHEGYCNFNAGTLGESMVEGRISQGVVIGDGSDVGGGASTQGTLSGGGKERVAVGKRCLLGAESGLGIALGDDCTVEAGLYLTAGTLVLTPDGEVRKARELSGMSGLLFRRHSQSGAVEAIAQKVDWGALNAELHAN